MVLSPFKLSSFAKKANFHCIVLQAEDIDILNYSQLLLSFIPIYIITMGRRGDRKKSSKKHKRRVIVESSSSSESSESEVEESSSEEEEEE